MKRIINFLATMLTLVLVTSCNENNDVRMLTIVNEDGTCKRQVSYRAKMSEEEFDSIWKADNHLNTSAIPCPECLVVDSMMSLHADPQGDSVTFTWYQLYNDIEDLGNHTPLRMNGVPLKSHTKLDKQFRWFYTEYRFEETFESLGDKMPVPITDLSCEDTVKYWFTGIPNLAKGKSGAEITEMNNGIEPIVTKWFNENLVSIVINEIADRYDSISNPPVSKEEFLSLRDSLGNYIINNSVFTNDFSENGMDADEIFQKFFHSNAYDIFFEDDSKLADEVGEKLMEYYNIFAFNVSYALQLPGKVVEVGNGELVGDSVICYPLTGERLIPVEYTVSATSRVTHIWAYIVSIVVILIAAFCWISLRRKNG